MANRHLAPARRPILTTDTQRRLDIAHYYYPDDGLELVLPHTINHQHLHGSLSYNHYSLPGIPDHSFNDSHLPSAHRYPYALDSRHDYLRSLINSDLSTTTVWSGFGAGKQAVLSVSVPAIAAAPFVARGGRRGNMAYRTPAERAHSIMCADEPIVDTAPNSPPELSYSKSSKSSSSSCRSLSLDNASREKLANFEDITLEETGRESVEDCNLKPESRPTLKRPTRTSTEKLEIAKRNAAPQIRDTTNGNARGYPSLQVVPQGRGMRRGFTSPHRQHSWHQDAGTLHDHLLLQRV